jgi:hypothetical protein
MNIQFGTGVLFGLPNAGNLATNPTPFKFPVLQEASVEFKADLKKLFGTSQFPVAKARGKIDVTCKAKTAAFDPNFLNQLYFGQAAAAGVTAMAVDEAGTIPTTPYQITVAHSVNFVTDYGVIDTATGKQLTKVASGPTTGQYSVAAGVYTFAVADTTKTVKISYSYTDSTSGETITLANQLMGFAPEFRAFLFSNFRTKRLGIELYSCTMGQMTIPTKQEDFWMADLTFDAGVDATDTLGQIYADLV